VAETTQDIGNKQEIVVTGDMVEAGASVVRELSHVVESTHLVEQVLQAVLLCEYELLL